MLMLWLGFLPFVTPDSTGAIPKHCFERSALRSGSYLVGDLLMLAAFAYLASFIDGIFGKNGSVLDGFVGQSARVAAWAVYCFCAGSVGTGVWVIAHECECVPSSPAVRSGERARAYSASAIKQGTDSALLALQADTRPSLRARPSTTPSAGSSTLLSLSLTTAGGSAMPVTTPQPVQWSETRSLSPRLVPRLA